MKKLIYILLILPILAFGQDEDPCYSINDYNLLTELNNPRIEINLVSGWNMIGYPCTQEVIVSDAFSSIVNEITIVKDNNGNVYMPEFSFNGIGFLEGGQGYQIKMTDFVLGFTFCQSIQFPTIEGCTDCEASNFSKLATTDDGSCVYDTDGDGVLDSLEIVGCQDVTACNYNELATDAGLCNYVEPYFNCDGTPQIGASYEGGIVFYFDETEQRGLVAASEDIGDYEWGCVDVMIEGADEQAIGYGLQNTNDIVAVCTDTTIAASAALTYESNGFNDWFLPSFDELHLMETNISESSQIGNIGQFNNWWNWSSSEMNETVAFATTFSGEGCYMCENYKSAEGAVRPIRAFGNWIMGCMDETACNFNSEANMADGSCTYAEQGYDCDGNIIAQIGDVMEGGYLFYINDSQSGGLVASFDYLQSEGIWGCFGTNVNGADEIGIGYGYINTLDIVNQGCGGSALQMILDCQTEGYNDWYLPSRNELLEIYNIIENIDGLDSHSFWSSSERNSNEAYMVQLINNNPAPSYKSDTRRIMPIRAFGNWTIGCMDSLACNYNPEANMADGSCTYPEQGYDCDGNQIFEIGDFANGGIVFYLDETGQHGLVAAIEDLDGTYEWGCYNQPVNGANGQAIGTGYQNTLYISNQGCETEYGGLTATQATLNYESFGYTDWYLPSLNELIEMFNSNIGGFQNGFYWSSSEFNYTFAWSISSADNSGYNYKYALDRVRAIRSF